MDGLAHQNAKLMCHIPELFLIFKSYQKLGMQVQLYAIYSENDTSFFDFYNQPLYKVEF